MSPGRTALAPAGSRRATARPISGAVRPCSNTEQNTTMTTLSRMIPICVSIPACRARSASTTEAIPRGSSHAIEARSGQVAWDQDAGQHEAQGQPDVRQQVPGGEEHRDETEGQGQEQHVKHRGAAATRGVADVQSVHEQQHGQDYFHGAFHRGAGQGLDQRGRALPPRGHARPGNSAGPLSAVRWPAGRGRERTTRRRPRVPRPPSRGTRTRATGTAPPAGTPSPRP